MKIEGSVQELELFFKKFNLIEKAEIKIDGTKVGEQIVPSAKNTLKEIGNLSDNQLNQINKYLGENY